MSDGAGRPEHMATLAPALLYFAPGAGLDVLGLLRGGEEEARDGLGEL